MARPRKNLPGVNSVKSRLWNTAGRVDRRKSADISGARRAAAGKKGRGADINSVKRDADLEARIEMVVQTALSSQADVNEDVIRGGEHFIRLNGLKASRIG